MSWTVLTFGVLQLWVSLMCSGHTLIFFNCGFLLAFLHVLYVSHKLNLLILSSRIS